MSEKTAQPVHAPKGWLALARNFAFPDPSWPPMTPPAPGSRPALARERILARPLPSTRYGIFFMPRSSSSRLTDIAEAAGLGRPGEFMNPRFLPRMTEALGSASIEEHVDALIRKATGPSGAFGIEVTPNHVRTSFGRLKPLSDAFGIERWAWLVRRDMVAQAVSSVRVRHTGKGHDTGPARGEAPQRGPLKAPYEPERIRHTLIRLFVAERAGEAMLRGLPEPPLRLSYEGLTAMTESEVAAGLGAWIGRAPRPVEDGSGHRKLPGGEGAEQAARFRAENPLLCRAVEIGRRRTLRAIPDTPFEGI